MIRLFSLLLILLSAAGAVGHYYQLALPSLRWFFEFEDNIGYGIMIAAFLSGLFLLFKGGKDVHWRPMTLRKFDRFKSIRRGYISFWLFIVLIVVALLDQALVGKRALAVNYEGQWYFPAFQQKQYSGVDFGQTEESEANYRELKKDWKSKASENWLIMPLVPWDPVCLLYTSPSPRDLSTSRMPSSA